MLEVRGIHPPPYLVAFLQLQQSKDRGSNQAGDNARQDVGREARHPNWAAPWVSACGAFSVCSLCFTSFLILV